MSDDLIKRLRKGYSDPDGGGDFPPTPIEREAADALEAQEKRIAELESALKAEQDEVFRLQCSHSALYARVQELESDAARYRWLRNGDHWPAAFADCHAPEPLLGSDLDAAIDAALKEKQ